MDFLKEELERKRKLFEEAKPTKKAKFIKGKDLIEAEWKQKQQAFPKREEDLSPEKPSEKGILSDLETQDEDFKALYLNISDQDVVKRLRSRGQPIRLFGESNSERLLRLRKLEEIEKAMEGQRNDFKVALAAAEREILEDNLKNINDKSSDLSPARDLTANFDTTAISLELLKTHPVETSLLIGVYLKRMLNEWDQFFRSLPEEEKLSMQGRQQKAIQAQSAEYMKPFFKQLRKRRIPPDVLARMAEICKYMQEREYLKANDVYLRLSIGNSPWPIGVTMVGIHERSAREKIFSSQVAHVLNDETQRKWIQSIKRLMTFVQKKYPPSDSAKMMG